MPALLAVLAAHLEDVREVRVEDEVQVEADRVEAVVEDAHLTVEPVGREHGDPVQMDRLAPQDAAAVDEHVWIRQVDDRRGVVLGQSRAQQERAVARDAELEAAQAARAIAVETELAEAAAHDVAVAIEHREGVVGLQDVDAIVEARIGRDDRVSGCSSRGLDHAVASSAGGSARPEDGRPRCRARGRALRTVGHLLDREAPFHVGAARGAIEPIEIRERIDEALVIVANGTDAGIVDDLGVDPQRRVRTGSHAMASIMAWPNGSGQRMGKFSARASRRRATFSRSSTSPMKSTPGPASIGSTTSSKYT